MNSEDFVVAPINPTLDMCRAGQQQALRNGLPLPVSAMAVIYKAMVSADPEQGSLGELYELLFGEQVENPSVADLLMRLRKFHDCFGTSAIDPEEMQDALRAQE